MNEYIVLWRFGNGHISGGDVVNGDSAKSAFQTAVLNFFDESKYDKYTAFFVGCSNQNVDEFERSYGYDAYGQRSCYNNGVRMAQKWIIDNILIDKDL